MVKHDDNFPEKDKVNKNWYQTGKLEEIKWNWREVMEYFNLNYCFKILVHGFIMILSFKAEDLKGFCAPQKYRIWKTCIVLRQGSIKIVYIQKVTLQKDRREKTKSKLESNSETPCPAPHDLLKSKEEEQRASRVSSWIPGLCSNYWTMLPFSTNLPSQFNPFSSLD